MSMEELTEELRAMEKALGKERFNSLLEEAIQNFGNSADDEDRDFDDEDEDDFYDIDLVTTSEWCQTYPANIVCGSDLYYAELANENHNKD